MAVTIYDLLEAANRSIRFPHSALQIAELAGRDDAATTELSALIELDPAFSIRLLKLVNSPAFGMPKKIESIQEALTRVGRKGIAELALVQASASAFDVLESSLMRATTFWEHSRLVATLARDIADEAGLVSDTAFLAGLLHDIGLLLMFHELSDEMSYVLEHSLDQHVGLTVSEREVFGFDHAQLGAALAREWRLPPVLGAVMRFHHEPAAADEFEDVVACVALANEVVSDTQLGEPDTQSALDHFERTQGYDRFPVIDILSRSIESVSRYAIN